MVQRKLGAGVNVCPVKFIPLKYKEDTIHDEIIRLEYKEDTVHEEATGIQGNKTEESLADPSLNCVVLVEKDQHREVRVSTGKRKLSKGYIDKHSSGILKNNNKNNTNIQIFHQMCKV
jgi:hypothetical protein